MSFTPQFIAPTAGGLTLNKKPFLLMDGAWQRLMNAYAWRDRIKKREGILLIGRLRRIFSEQASGSVTIGIGQTVFNIFTLLGITELHPNIEPGNVGPITFIFGSPLSQVWNDTTGTAQMTGFSGGITSVSINYSTGDVTVQSGTAYTASTLTVTINYYPSLPVMGIPLREIGDTATEQTILYDTKYCYTYVSQSFQELVPGTTWAGTDNDFFWATNWRGINAFDRLFFVTNFVNDAADPIRYFDGIAWNPFFPLLASNPPTAPPATYLTQARILIPYYGRLLALNTWETTDSGTPGTPNYTTSHNFFNRCRFSAIGNPLAVDAWRTDIFGQGGFIDCPVNEIIISAAFYKNVLIVWFQGSTWRLRYVGEYGLPFLWERISADFGCASTFSTILFDQGVLAISDRAIVTTSGNDVSRIDLDIPDVVFQIEDANEGHQRVCGIRDYQKELVYWAYPDGPLGYKFPNYTLLYNYRNNTWAQFRNTITTYGNLASPAGISWDSQDITWDSAVTWDTYIQEEFLDIISGNQQGYIHFYADPNSETIMDSQVPAFDQESLYISAIDLTGPMIIVTSYSHNLQHEEIIYITGLLFVNTLTGTFVPTSLNNQIYQVAYIDQDTFGIVMWDFSAQLYTALFSYIPLSSDGATYMGGGQITLFPVMDMITKDFNPLMQAGLQCKFGHLDFLCDATPTAEVTVNLYNNASLEEKANVEVGQRNSSTALTSSGYITAITNANPCQITCRMPHGLANGDSVIIQSVGGMTNINGIRYFITYVDSLNFSINVDSTSFPIYTNGGNWQQVNFPFYCEGQDYTWQRFYAGTQGNFFSLQFTYDDNLMNTFATHQQDFVLNALRIWTKPGGSGVY